MHHIRQDFIGVIIGIRQIIPSKMDSRMTILVALCIVGPALALPESHPTYLIPGLQKEGKQTQPQGETITNAYEYQIVPSSEYAITQYDSETSLMDFILSPITALSSICSRALSVISWVFSNGVLVFLGMAVVIGFCALTPYCTLTIEQTFARELRSSASYIPYLDEIESFFIDAYNKYNGIQSAIY
ncbi:hypothetical protein K1T71_006737 [Dendrolimus kikuchii]|uniref:Uncharacterized protein n=1 Tax=Dendrolimus kikuchii TaxID=765133 RepID=A0ACC1D2A5_9NEOP|nr:hypothetical protein K1T71_006737 [Dendrolimus kikuchii]